MLHLAAAVQMLYPAFLVPPLPVGHFLGCRMREDFWRLISCSGKTGE